MTAKARKPRKAKAKPDAMAPGWLKGSALTLDEIRSELYRLGGLLAALADQANNLHNPHEPIGDLDDAGHLAVADRVWPMVVLIGVAREVVRDTGKLVEDAEAQV